MWAYIILIFIILWIVDWVRRIPWVSGLHKKCVVITGCDSGFGNALANSLHSKGVYVFAGCFTDEGAKKLTEETGERVKTFKLDVGKTQTIEDGFSFVKNNLPADTVLWGLVNNAGIPGIGGPVEFLTRDDMSEVMNVNCFGMIEMVRVFMPLLKQSRGRIVNTASMAGKVATANMTPYTASKFAVAGFSDSLRHEKLIWGIKVSTVCPGMFNTPIVNLDSVKIRFDKKWKSLDPTIKEEYGDIYGQTLTAMKTTIPAMFATDLTPVVDAYEHALFARRPKHCYYPGKDALFIVTIYKYFPQLSDYFVAKFSTKPMPKALLKS